MQKRLNRRSCRLRFGLRWAQEKCTTCGPDPPCEGAIFRGKLVAQVQGLSAAGAVQKRPNCSRCRLKCGLGCVQGTTEGLLDGGPGTTRGRAILRAKRGRLRTCPAVDKPIMIQQGQHRYGADIDWSVLDGVHTGATWRILLKCACRLMSNY